MSQPMDDQLLRRLTLTLDNFTERLENLREEDTVDDMSIRRERLRYTLLNIYRWHGGLRSIKEEIDQAVNLAGIPREEAMVDHQAAAALYRTETHELRDKFLTILRGRPADLIPEMEYEADQFLTSVRERRPCQVVKALTWAFQLFHAEDAIAHRAVLFPKSTETRHPETPAEPVSTETAEEWVARVEATKGYTLVNEQRELEEGDDTGDVCGQ